jgi:hypothetical protein
MTDRYSLFFHSLIMAEAIMDAALMVLAGVPEMNQVITLCGFTNPVE